MAFFLGLILSAMLMGCILLESSGVLRFLFSVILLGGIFWLFFVVFTAGLLLTVPFLAGLAINLIFFSICLPIIMVSEEKDKKNGK